MRFAGENITEAHTDSSSTTSAEENTVRPVSYIVAEQRAKEKTGTTLGVSAVSSSLTDRGKFTIYSGREDMAVVHIVCPGCLEWTFFHFLMDGFLFLCLK